MRLKSAIRPQEAARPTDTRRTMSEAHVKIMCPSLVCRKVLSVPAIARGQTVRCKACGTVIRIPEKAAPAETAAPAPKGKERAA